MCARVTLTVEDIDELADTLDAELSPEDARRYKRRYNVAPSDTHWMVEYGADRRVLVPAKWGYIPTSGPSRTSPPGRARKPLINVRGEQVASGHGFREAFASRRCAVVTDGFFEWNGRREPFWYHRPDGGLVLLAGLFQDAPAGQPDRDPRFTVLTTRPNKLIAAVHDRMPVIVPAARVDDWLAAPATEAAALIAPAPEDALIATPVSKRVNKVANDDAACLAPAQPGGQGSLF
jgi:putative SOS response-associated peptidase YedK